MDRRPGPENLRRHPRLLATLSSSGTPRVHLWSVEAYAAELTTLGFQALVTTLLALVNLGLWRQEGRPAYLTWASSWALYAARLVFISAFLVSRNETWLFLHQVATGGSALLLLWAALQFSRGTPFRRRYLWAVPAVVFWSWFAVFQLHDPAVAGLSSAVALSAVTLWTGRVFWRYQRQTGSGSARVLAWTFLLWGLHHLDYPLLRPLGRAVLLGAMADVVFIVAAAGGMVFLGLTKGREALAARTAQLEQLTHLLLRAQEEERRRIARDLHDEAGQILTAVKIELDLDGKPEAAELVSRALNQVRDIGNLLRPSTLDDFGLLPSLRSLVEDFSQRYRIEARFEGPRALPSLATEADVTIYRVIQEALTNVARHAAARSVLVVLTVESATIRLTVEDDGSGVAGPPIPRLGLLGMRERMSALDGRLAVTTSRGSGFRIEATIPRSDRA
jgi:signal transduction histidine kinase